MAMGGSVNGDAGALNLPSADVQHGAYISAADNDLVTRNRVTEPEVT
jgi:hypothetical protein